MSPALPTPRRACQAVEVELRVEVHPVVIEHERGTARKAYPFVAQIRSQPLVAIPLKW